MNFCPLIKPGNVPGLPLMGADCENQANLPGTAIIRATFDDTIPIKGIPIMEVDLLVHIFHLSDALPEKDFLDGDEEIPACEQWELPNVLLDGLWDSIIVDPTIKNRLLGYCNTSMAFSDAKIDSNIINWNRMAMCYGPPGTGKTSLCKALAQKAYIRSSETHFDSGVLLEVNSHSLFSKWFSESGKLVMKLFDHITEIAEDEDCFVCVLIDEVESIAASRTAASAGNDPGDAVRVVNAVLTSLDSLRRLPNVLVLCTSNMLGGIDAAFKDRLDISLYIGPPDIHARFIIIRSCMWELQESGLIYPRLSAEEFDKEIQQDGHQDGEGEGMDHSSHLMSMTVNGTGTSHSSSTSTNSTGYIPQNLPSYALMKQLLSHTEGLSGRGLRKIALRAHAFYLQKPRSTLSEYISAMALTAESCISDESPDVCL
jgi:hypothetical protein